MILDVAVNAFMQTIETPVLTVVSKTIAPIFDPIVLIVLSLIIVPYIYIKSSRRNGVLFGITIVITGGLIVALKQTFERMRPLNTLLPELSSSFPSGHATMAVVFFGLLVHLFVSKKYKVHGIIIAGLIVALIGLSRVYLRVHWLTDVLGGFVFGGIILAVSIWAFRKN